MCYKSKKEIIIFNMVKAFQKRDGKSTIFLIQILLPPPHGKNLCAPLVVGTYKIRLKKIKKIKLD